VLVKVGLHIEMGWQGRTSGLGVVSVWMNIVLRPMLAPEVAVCWTHRGAWGLCWRGEDVMGDAFWCRQRVAALGVLEVGLIARDKVRSADRGSVVEAIAMRSYVC